MEECIHLLPPAHCALCNGRVAHERKVAAADAHRVEYRFVARYDSTASCGHQVLTGEPLLRLGNGNLVCTDCDPT